MEESATIERQVAQLLDRNMQATVLKVTAACEDRTRKLEEDKVSLRERMTETTAPAGTFEESLTTALEFLANPWNLWRSGVLYAQR